LPAADNGYEIVYKKQAARNYEERQKAAQIDPSVMVLSNDGSLFIIEEYDDYYRLLKTSPDLKNTKELIIKRNFFGIKKIHEPPFLIPCANGDLLLQSFHRDTEDSDPEKIVLHITKDLKVKNKFRYYGISYTLPALKDGQDFYYTMGELEKKPKVRNDFLMVRDKDGNYIKSIKLNNKSTDSLMAILFLIVCSEAYTVYNNKYMLISNYDLFAKKNFRLTPDSNYDKAEKNPGLYVLDPEKGRFDKIADLTDKINAAYKRLNGHTLKNLTVTNGIFYDAQNKRSVFMLREYARFTICSEPLSKNIVSYKLVTGEFKMIKLGPEFGPTTYSVGVWKGIHYVSDWDTGMLYGLKF
jgi:hypothetical protein